MPNFIFMKLLPRYILQRKQDPVFSPVVTTHGQFTSLQRLHYFNSSGGWQERDKRRRAGDMREHKGQKVMNPDSNETHFEFIIWPDGPDGNIPTSKTHTDLSAGTRDWNLHWSSSGSKVSLFMILFFSSGGMKFSMIRYLHVHNAQQCKALVWGHVRNKWLRKVYIYIYKSAEWLCFVGFSSHCFILLSLHLKSYSSFTVYDGRITRITVYTGLDWIRLDSECKLWEKLVLTRHLIFTFIYLTDIFCPNWHTNSEQSNHSSSHLQTLSIIWTSLILAFGIVKFLWSMSVMGVGCVCWTIQTYLLMLLTLLDACSTHLNLSSLVSSFWVCSSSCRLLTCSSFTSWISALMHWSLA